MCNKYSNIVRMGGAYKMGPKPRTVQEDTACTGCLLKVTQFIAPVALKIAFYCILREDVVTDIVGGALTEAPQAWLLIVKL